MAFLELKIPPLLLTALFAAAIFAVAQWQALPLIDQLIATIVSVALFLMGFAALAIGAFQFRFVKTTLNPVKPDASTLVTTGIYRYTRNPMYLGMLLLLAGLVCYCNNVLSLFVLPLFVLYMNRFQIIPEERFLLEKFGEEYVVFLRTTRRWM